MSFKIRRLADSEKSFGKQIQWILLFGVLWGITEVFIGSWLKTLQPALFGITIPFVTILIILTAKHFAPVPGSILLMALIAAPIKFFFSGMILHGAFMAILLEAFLAEFTFALMGFKFIAFILAGILIELYSLFHPLLSRGVFCQSTHFVFFKRWLENLINSGSAESISESSVTFVLLSLHILMGVLAGIITWRGIRYFTRDKF